MAMQFSPRSNTAISVLHLGDQNLKPDLRLSKPVAILIGQGDLS